MPASLYHMILYNVTITVDPGIQDEWFNYMRGHHIPDVLATGCFSGYKMFQVLSVQQEGEITFSIQYFCADIETYEFYNKEFAPRLQKEHQEKFGEKAPAFRTLLELV